MADDAGALLVRSGLVTASALEEARARVANIGGTIGEQLVATGAITDDALTAFYRARLLVPQVNPNLLARLLPKVLSTIPGDLAIELRAIPVSLDGDNNLTVAMSDPSDRHAVDEIEFFTGAYVVRAVATQMQIAWCLAHYYGHVTGLGQRLLQTSDADSSAEAAISTAPRLPRTKGLTGKVDAARHRAIAPVTGPVNVVRPSSRDLDVPPGAPPLAPQPAPAPSTPLPRTGAEASALSPHAPPLRAASSPVIAETVDGAPEAPRARSVSGEIRVPVRRAASIRPPVPEPHEPEDDLEDTDSDEPLIVIEGGDEGGDDLSAPRPLPRRRAVKSDPPELYARAGEVALKGAHDRAIDSDEPRIVIDEDALAPETRRIDTRTIPRAPSPPQITLIDDGVAAPLIHDAESQPILLDQPRTPPGRPAALAPPPAESEEDDDTGEIDIVVLETRKPRQRPERRTQVGIPPAPALPRVHRDTEASGVPAMFDAGGEQTAPTAEPLEEPTSIDLRAAPADDEPGADEIVAPPPPVFRDDTDPRLGVRPQLAQPRPRSVPSVVVEDPDAELEDHDEDEDPRGEPTAVRSAAELDPRQAPGPRPGRHIEHDAVDDGWGPPGTTIPPPLLGAVPGSDDDGDTDERGVIPMPNIDSSPLMVGPPSLLPAVEAGGLVRALEHATARAIEVIRQLERTESRDEVVDLMIAYLGETHHRAGFLVCRPGPLKGTSELGLFAMTPRPAVTPFATLRLDRPSTLQDVVGTRLPYRGPMHDDASRTFLISILGACPAEILLVPVAVRERVVGVLFGEHRQRHTFDDQLALAARASGMALERILKAKR